MLTTPASPVRRISWMWIFVNSRGRILVLGVGNELYGDDGVGPLAVATLEAENTHKEVVLMDGGTRGLDLLYTLQEFDRAIVIDAVTDGGEGGRLLDFDLEEVDLRGYGPQISLHDLDLSSVIQLARTLGEELPPIRVLGLTPVKTDPGPGLSPECEKMMPELLARVREHLARNVEIEPSTC